MPLDQNLNVSDRSRISGLSLDISEQEESNDRVHELRSSQPSPLSNVLGKAKRISTLQKQKTILQAMKQVRRVSDDDKGADVMVDSEILDMEHSLEAFEDEKGRTIRWRRTYDQQSTEKGPHCKMCRGGLDCIEAEAQLTQLEEELYDRLEVRQRAISNWKRLRIVIVILRMCNGRLEEKNHKKPQEEDNKKQSFDDIFARFVISPYSKYILVWNLLTTLSYFISIFIDTLVLGFHLRPLLDADLQTCTTVFSATMVIDVVLKFFVAFRQNSALVEIEDTDEEKKNAQIGANELAVMQEINERIGQNFDENELKQQ